jgi:hypothetical protein
MPYRSPPYLPPVEAIPFCTVSRISCGEFDADYEVA